MRFVLGISLVFFLFSAVFLILFVLFQDDQGSGGGLFSGSSATPFGAAGANILQKITGTLGALLFASAVIYSFSNRVYYGVSRDLQFVTKSFGEVEEESIRSPWWEEDNEEEFNVVSDGSKEHPKN